MAKHTKPTGLEVFVNSLFWLAMTVSVVGLFVYGIFQLRRLFKGEGFHYFKNKTIKEKQKPSGKAEPNEEPPIKPRQSQLTNSQSYKPVFQAPTQKEQGKNKLQGLRVDWKHHDRSVSAKDQAEQILNKALKDIESGAKGVAITYSANLNQREAIATAYLDDKPTTGISGANQAAVAHTIERYIPKSRKYEALRGKFHIVPITTMEYTPQIMPVENEIVLEDLCNVACYIGAGWKVYGWQNQDVNFDNKDKYFAVGGGVSARMRTPPPKDQFHIIQHSLLSLSSRADLLPKNPDGTWENGVTPEAADRYKEAFEIGKEADNPLAYTEARVQGNLPGAKI